MSVAHRGLEGTGERVRALARTGRGQGHGRRWPPERRHGTGKGKQGRGRCSGDQRRGEAARATAGAAGAREAQRQQRLQGQMRALGVASAGATGRARADVRVATVTAH